jgi:hypothetical protein
MRTAELYIRYVIARLSRGLLQWLATATVLGIVGGDGWESQTTEPFFQRNNVGLVRGAFRP